MAGVTETKNDPKNVLYPGNPDWMKNLPESLHTTPLNELAIPGSHDSFTFYLDKTSDVGPDTSQAIRDLVKVFGGMAKDVIFKWSQTQSLSFADQLKAGIRYYDFRIASKPGSEDTYFIHCLYGSKVEASLQEINGYLEEHPTEVVILDFNHFYGMNESMHKQFMAVILETFGAKICPQKDMKTLTLDMLWQNKFQVVAIYQDDVVKDFDQFWPASCIQSQYANTTDPTKMVQFFEKTHSENRPANTFQTYQGVLTPDATYIISRFSGSLKNDLVAKAGPVFVQWLKKKKRGNSGINICTMDFIEKESFIFEMLGMNK
ncbi:PI-PLC X domain-containing protein 3-like [Haliotis rubra]|uniref:PI-PLC X domain-containing protein 3-like n=1 Tax=Haliotis rubra TaxID=36100 RepID=UPI001EE58476|nr:PI-PLC X domain-containing protein 3-like [Haliotis rubra]